MTAASLLLSMLAALQATPPAPLTVEAIRAMPAPTIAERLIGPQQGADVERSEVRWDGMLPGGAELRLFHRPVPFAGDMCSQRVHYLSLLLLDPTDATSLPRDRQSLRVTHIRDNETIAMAPSCRTAPRQSFAYINPLVGRMAAVQALRNLWAARAAAARRGRLPFRVACRDVAPDPGDRCRRGGRRTLATLPIERAWLISNNDDSQISIAVGEPGQVFWRVVITDFGSERARVSLTWMFPPPF